MVRAPHDMRVREGLKFRTPCTIGGTRGRGAQARRNVEGMSLQWHVVRARSSCESQVAQAITDQGYETFLPIVTFLRRKRDGLLVEVQSPLITSFLFASFDVDRPGWRSIWNTRGVVGIMGPPERPSPVRDFEEFRKQLGDALPLFPSRPKIIPTGALVRIMFGPFRDRCATVQADLGSRVEVLLRICGAETPVKFDREVLVMAA